jgi:hypothetical protein
MATQEATHRLVKITPNSLRCQACGERATVGSGSHRITVTGYRIHDRLMACEECLAYWAGAHRCQTAA